MKKQSAGILMFRRTGKDVEVLLAHPGGPFWSKKDKGAWSIPKGEVEPGEDMLATAKREFAEETGQPAPEGTYVALQLFKRSDGKEIFAWAVEGSIDVSQVSSNTFDMEWPRKSGQVQQFPEIDKAAWVSIQKAPPKLHKGQDTFVEQLAVILGLESIDAPAQQSLL